MHFCRRSVAAFLNVLLAAECLASGQNAPGSGEPAVAAAQTPQKAGKSAALRILVLEGQNAVNSTVTGSAISPLVQVLDVLDRPVAGAIVAFEVLPTGPGGTFGNAPIATTKTDYSGQATAVFTPNRTPGAFSIKVTASYGGETAQTRINQRNADKVAEAMVQRPPKPWYGRWQWWTLIGAGAAAGLTTAFVINGNGGQAQTITISPGTVVIGGQR